MSEEVYYTAEDLKQLRMRCVAGEVIEEEVLRIAVKTLARNVRERRGVAGAALGTPVHAPRTRKAAAQKEVISSDLNSLMGMLGLGPK